MTSPTDISKNSLIPTGPWTMYFHSPEETKWTLNTFVSLGPMKTWNDFWNIMEALNIEYLSDGMFFMMRDPSPPLWESSQNIRGGCYSFRYPKKEAHDAYLDFIIAAMLGSVTSPENRINGITISPKRGFNIIKLWNTDAQKFYNPLDINIPSSNEVIYTPFVQKKM